MSKQTKGKPESTEEAVPFEQLLQEVETRLKALEEGNLSLDDSLKAYEAGVKALRGCYAHLKAAEGRIEVLTATGQEPEVAEFDTDSGRPIGKSRKVGGRKKIEEESDADEPSDESGKALF